jgi:hypothetical protein
MKFKMELLGGNNLVVNCKTDEQWKTLLNWAKQTATEQSNNKAAYDDLMEDWCEFGQESCLDLFNRDYDTIETCKTMQFEVLSYEEALLKESNEENTIVLTEAVAAIHRILTGDYDFDKITYLVNDLLDRNFRVDLVGTGISYELKGYKKEDVEFGR